MLFGLSVSSNVLEPFCTHFNCSFDHLPVTLQPQEKHTLAAFNQKEDCNPSPLNAKASEDSFTALLHTGNKAVTIWHNGVEGTGCAGLIKMAEFTFQSRGGIATETGYSM